MQADGFSQFDAIAAGVGAVAILNLSAGADHIGGKGRCREHADEKYTFHVAEVTITLALTKQN